MTLAILDGFIVVVSLFLICVVVLMAVAQQAVKDR